MNLKIKVLFFFITTITFLTCNAQNDPEVFHISNNKNINLSPIKDIKTSKNPIDYSFEMKVTYIGFAKFHNRRVAELINEDEYEMNTAIEFISSDRLKYYYYPINNNIFSGLDNFKNLNKNLTEPINVKFYLTIFNSDNNPVVIINKVSIIDE